MCWPRTQAVTLHCVDLDPDSAYGWVCRFLYPGILKAKFSSQPPNIIQIPLEQATPNHVRVLLSH